MIAYYLERGHSLSELINMTYLEKLFMLEAIAFNNREQSDTKTKSETVGNKKVEYHKIL